MTQPSDLPPLPRFGPPYSIHDLHVYADAAVEAAVRERDAEIEKLTLSCKQWADQAHLEDGNRLYWRERAESAERERDEARTQLAAAVWMLPDDTLAGAVQEEVKVMLRLRKELAELRARLEAIYAQPTVTIWGGLPNVELIKRPRKP